MGSPPLESVLRRGRADILKSAYKQYDLNNQTAVSLLDLSSRLEIGVVSKVSADVLSACGMKPCIDPEAFLADALERRRADRIAVIKEGHNVLPRLGSGGGA